MPESIPSSDSGITVREYLESLIATTSAKLMAEIENVRRELTHISEKSNIIVSTTQRAVDKAEADMNERLKGMNEFRAQLGDQAATFATREQLDDKLAPVFERIEANRTQIGLLQNRMSNYDGRVWALGVVLVVVQVLLKLLWK